MNHLRTYLILPCLLSGFLTLSGNSQDEQSLQWKLSRLRGMWETHTYKDKFRIAFISDRKMVYDRREADYELDQREMRIHSEDGELSYSYTILNDNLLLVDPAGKEMRLKRELCGINERDLIGEYFTGYDLKDCEQQLSFNEDGTFNYSKQCRASNTDSITGSEEVRFVDVDRRDGFYRVENAFVILDFGNQLVGKAVLRYRDEDNKITGIAFSGKIFDRERHVYYADGPVIDPIPPPPPPCYWCRDPPPPPPQPWPDPPCDPPSGGPIPTQPLPGRDHRDTGSTRGSRQDTQDLPSSRAHGGTTAAQSVPPVREHRESGSARGSRPDNR